MRLFPTDSYFDGPGETQFPGFKLAPVPGFLPEAPQTPADPGDGLSGANSRGPSASFEKITLVPSSDDDYFGRAAVVAQPVRTATHGTALKLAGTAHPDFAGLGDAPEPATPQGEFRKGTASASRADSSAPKLLDTERITRRIFKSTVEIGGRTRTLLHGQWNNEPFEMLT